MDLPKLIKVRQRFSQEHIEDPAQELRRRLAEMGLGRYVHPGERVAITVGSRGIAAIAQIARTLVEALKEVGARPFIVPAMGSHGGATAAGQLEVLAEYGVTEEKMGVPILSSMEVVELGRTGDGVPVYMDRNAYSAEATIVMGRVKPHTLFHAEIESGLCKMMAVGLGKQQGAEAMHAWGLAKTIPPAAQVVLEKANIALGIGIVENAYHQTLHIAVVPPERILEADRELLRLARKHYPRVPFDRLHLLVVDWMGKDISGSGMDNKIIGLWRRVGGEIDLDYRRLVPLRVTPGSHGNAMGVGCADLIPRKLYEALDFAKLYANALTAGAVRPAMIPIVMGSDREALETALQTAGPMGDGPHLARIKSTLHLGELYVSPALLAEARENPNLEVVGEPEEMRFDAEGNIELDLWEE